MTTMIDDAVQAQIPSLTVQTRVLPDADRDLLRRLADSVVAREDYDSSEAKEKPLR